ncbi:MAG TPA: ATP-binding protein [Rhizomicrobium sp.]
MKLARTHVRLRIGPFLALGMALGLVVAGLFMAGYEEALFRNKVVADSTGQARILAASVTAALAFNDARTAQEYVNALHANPDMEAAGVYASNGRRVAGFTTTAPLPSTVNAPISQFSGDGLVVALPAIQGNEHLGFVYLRTRIESLERRFSRYAILVLLLTMAGLVLTVLATAQNSLTRANNLLEARARDLANTNLQLEREMEERAKIEDALRQSQKMEALGQLSGGIAHDFNNLLAAIKGNQQLLERRLAQGRTDVGKYLAALREGTDRATALTQRVLAFSRRQPLVNVPVNLTVLVRGMEDLLRQSLGQQIRIETDLAADTWTICDPNQMENVLLNLAINARDATPTGGTLTIVTAKRHVETDEITAGDYVMLRVADTGSGMPEDVRVRAIEPFFTTKPPGRGTGLGLSSIFGYIKQSGGFLDIESELGKGTIVTILLPFYGGPEIPGKDKR